MLVNKVATNINNLVCFVWEILRICIFEGIMKEELYVEILQQARLPGRC